MNVSRVNCNPNFQGRLDASAQKIFARRMKNLDVANLNIGKNPNNSISVSYNIKPDNNIVTTMYVTDTSKFTNPFVSVPLAKGRVPFNEKLLNLIKTNIAKAEGIQKKYLG